MTSIARKRYRINRQIIFIFSLIILLLLVSAILNQANIRRYESSIQFIRNVSIEKLALLNLIELNAATIKLTVVHHLLTDDLEKMKKYEQQVDSLLRLNDNYYRQFTHVIISERIREKTNTVLEKRKEYLKYLNRAIEISYSGNRTNAIEFEENELRPAFNIYMNDLADLSLLVIQGAEENIANTFDEIHNVRRISNVFLGVGLLFIVLMTAILNRILKRLKQDYQLLETESEQKEKAQEELRKLYNQLEEKVKERTQELRIAICNFKEVNQKLQKANENLSTLESIIDLSDNPIIIRDMNDIITFWNKGAEKLYSCKKEEAVGKICHLFLNRKFQEPYGQIKEKLMEFGDWYGEISSKDKETGKEIIVTSNWKVYKNKKEEPVAILEIDHDITGRIEMEDEIRKYNKELKEINAAKDKIFSVISHDLRNPIAGLLSSSEILKNNIENFEKNEIKQFTDIIHKTSQKLLEQLNELVEWANSQLQQVIFNPIELKLCYEVNQGLKLLMSAVNQKNIRLENQVPDDIFVKADTFMLRSILQNLITNAIKFTEPGGHIIVAAHTKGAVVEVSVMDTGIGMSNEKIKNLFEKKIASSTEGTGKEAGTGLGLILVRDFVAQHNGIIRVESEVDKGTTITFTLPKA